MASRRPVPNSSLFPNGLFLSSPGKLLMFGAHHVSSQQAQTGLAACVCGFGSSDAARTHCSLYTSADGVIYLSVPHSKVERTWLLKDVCATVSTMGKTAPLYSSSAKDGGGGADSDSTEPPTLEETVAVARTLAGPPNQDPVADSTVLAFCYMLIGILSINSVTPSVKLTVEHVGECADCLSPVAARCAVMAGALLAAARIVAPPALDDRVESASWPADDNDKELVRRWTAAAGSLVHGRPAALDATVCVKGGMAVCEATHVKHVLGQSDKATLGAMVINPRLERTTNKLATCIRDKMNKYPAVAKAIIRSIDGVGAEASKLLCGSGTLQPADIYSRLNELCRMHNQLLCALGAGHGRTEQIATLLARYGLHPTLTSSGDAAACLYAILKPDMSPTVYEMMHGELSQLGYECMRVQLGTAGLMAHCRHVAVMPKAAPGADGDKEPAGIADRKGSSGFSRALSLQQ